MKAVSPMLFSSAPPRTGRTGDAAAAADEEFGAVIAAAIGIAQQPAFLSPSQPQRAVSERSTSAVDDARSTRSADPHGSDRTAAADEERADTSSSDAASTTNTPGRPATKDAATSDGDERAAPADTSTAAAQTGSGKGARGKAMPAKAAPEKAASAKTTQAAPGAARPKGAGPLEPAVEATLSKAVSSGEQSTSGSRVPHAGELGGVHTSLAGADPATASNAKPSAVVASTAAIRAVDAKAITTTPGARSKQAPQAASALPTKPADPATPAASTVHTDASSMDPPKTLPAQSPNLGGVVSQVIVTSDDVKAHHDATTGKDGHGAGDAKTAASTTAAGFDASMTAAVSATPTTPAAPAPSAPNGQAPAAPGTVPDQIVQVLAPLRTAKDGNYTVSLQLHPAELGPVTVRVAVHDGVLSVQLNADQQSGHDALHGSLADLRTQLQASGLRVGDIDLGNRTAFSQQQAGNPNAQGGFGQGLGQNLGQGGFGQSGFGQGGFGQAGHSRQDSPNYQPQHSSAGYGDGRDRRPAVGSSERDRALAAASDDAALDVRI